MKPSVLVMNPTGSVPAPWVEALCNQWMEESYVYLLCPGCGFREDNPRGVRFLSHDGKALPHFGELEAIITFETTETLRRLKEVYPEVLVRMIPTVGDILPDELMPSDSPIREHPLAA